MDQKSGIFRFILTKILGPFIILSLVFYTVFVVVIGSGVNMMEDTFKWLATTAALESVHTFVKSTAGYELHLERRMADVFENIRSYDYESLDELEKFVEKQLGDFKTHALEEEPLDTDYAIFKIDGSVIKPGDMVHIDKSEFTLKALKDLKLKDYIFKRIDEAYTVEGKEAFVKAGYMKVFPDTILAVRFYIKWIDVAKTFEDIKEIERKIKLIKSIDLYTSCLNPMAKIFKPLDPALKDLAEEVLKSSKVAVFDEGWRKRLIVPERLPILHDKQFSKVFLAVIDLDFQPLWKGYILSMTIFGLSILTIALLVVFRVRRVAGTLASSMGDLVNAMEEYGKSRNAESILNLKESGIEEIDSLTRSFQEMAQIIASHVEELEAANELLESSYEELERNHEELELAQLSFGKELAMIAEGYDENTGNHITRVGELSAFLAERMGLGEFFTRRMRHYAPLHDIGKILVPKEILLKPGKLTKDEFEEMKKHTLYGAILLEDVPGFEMALNIALYHHEKYDGSGYPFGIKGDSIPIEAQIVGLIDVYDALRSKRPYKEAFDHKTAMEIILRGDGRTKPENFNPDILRLFAELSEEIERLWEEIWNRETLLEEKFRKYFKKAFS